MKEREIGILDLGQEAADMVKIDELSFMVAVNGATDAEKAAVMEQFIELFSGLVKPFISVNRKAPQALLIEAWSSEWLKKIFETQELSFERKKHFFELFGTAYKLQDVTVDSYQDCIEGYFAFKIL